MFNLHHEREAHRDQVTHARLSDSDAADPRAALEPVLPVLKALDQEFFRARIRDLGDRIKGFHLDVDRPRLKSLPEHGEKQVRRQRGETPEGRAEAMTLGR
jgi:hypothetical protein